VTGFMCSVRYFGKRFLHFRCHFARRQRLFRKLVITLATSKRQLFYFSVFPC